MKNFILHQIYARYEKNVTWENCSFQKDLQITLWLFFRNIIFYNIPCDGQFENGLCYPDSEAEPGFDEALLTY